MHQPSTRHLEHLNNGVGVALRKLYFAGAFSSPDARMNAVPQVADFVRKARKSLGYTRPFSATKISPVVFLEKSQLANLAETFPLPPQELSGPRQGSALLSMQGQQLQRVRQSLSSFHQSLAT